MFLHVCKVHIKQTRLFFSSCQWTPSWMGQEVQPVDEERWTFGVHRCSCVRVVAAIAHHKYFNPEVTFSVLSLIFWAPVTFLGRDDSVMTMMTRNSFATFTLHGLSPFAALPWQPAIPLSPRVSTVTDLLSFISVARATQPWLIDGILVLLQHRGWRRGSPRAFSPSRYTLTVMNAAHVAPLWPLLLHCCPTLLSYNENPTNIKTDTQPTRPFKPSVSQTSKMWGKDIKIWCHFYFVKTLISCIQYFHFSKLSHDCLYYSFMLMIHN